MSKLEFTLKSVSLHRPTAILAAILSLFAAVLLMAPKPNEDGLPKLLILVEDETLITGGEFKSDVFPTNGADMLTLLGNANSPLMIELRYRDRAEGLWNEPGVGSVVGMVCEMDTTISNCRKNSGTNSLLLPSNSVQVGGPYAQIRVTNSSGEDSDFNISVWLQ